MTAHSYLHTHDLALAGHTGVQQVRNYEANGLICKYSGVRTASASYVL